MYTLTSFIDSSHDSNAISAEFGILINNARFSECAVGYPSVHPSLKPARFGVSIQIRCYRD
jgi:hypothetical protein